MDGNKLPSPCPEVEAFRRYYKKLLKDVDRPVDLAELLFSDGIISLEAKDSITSASTSDVEQRRAVLGAFQHALLQSSEPSATMRSLRRAFEQAGFSNAFFRFMERVVEGEYWLFVYN